MDIEAKKVSPAASTEADAALGFLASEGTAAFTEIDEKKLVRKIDWMTVPLMWAIYFLQYQDKILSKTPWTAFDSCSDLRYLQSTMPPSWAC